jgi:hypothetical protein
MRKMERSCVRKVHFHEESHQYLKEREKSRVNILDDRKKNTEKRSADVKNTVATGFPVPNHLVYINKNIGEEINYGSFLESSD